GNPISFNALAKPIPWIRPNIKTIRILQGFNSENKIFSTATKHIDRAMMGSVIAEETTIIFFMLSASVTECATVNAVACQRIVFILLLNKHKADTNKM